MKKLLLIILTITAFSAVANAQIRRNMSLLEAINLAHTNSLDAAIIKHNFLSSYWEYRSYKADLLPSLNLTGNIGNYDRSINRLQDAQTGEIVYVETNNLSNSLNLSIDQNIPFTGGTVSLYTNLERLDQFGKTKSVTYYSQPLSFSYAQPIGGYNQFKWDKKIEPQKYDLAKKAYVESMEQITLVIVDLFFDLAIKQNNFIIAQRNYLNTNALYDISKERFRIGTITKNDLLQLELRLLNDSMAISNTDIDYKISKFTIKNYLGIYDDSDIVLTVPNDQPDVLIDYQKVLSLWQKNSSFDLDSKIKRLNAQSEVARAKGTGGVDIMLNARFGLTQSGPNISSSYQDLIDQEVVGLSIRVPILDWGMRKGKIRMAKSLQDVVESQIKKNLDEKTQDIATTVLKFNAQTSKCRISQKANSIADERYNIVMQRFKNGDITVTDANNAQTEQDDATKAYIQDMKDLWVYYYQIRELTLYDFITQTDISEKMNETVPIEK